MNVRNKNDLKQWFKFFLVGVIETAKSSSETFDNILKLQQQVDTKIQKLGSRSANAQKVMNSLYQHPLINASKVGVVTGLSSASVYKLIADLEKLEILQEITGDKRSKQYLFKEYIDLFK
jgi:Fic family protein